MSAARNGVAEILQRFRSDNPHMPKLNQAVEEFVECVMELYLDSPGYQNARVLDRLIEPDRVISFRVTWMDDQHRMQINRAWRVQHNNCLGAYKGGLRFHPSVDEDTLRFLGFDQTLKNSLTGLPMGGAKGGSDFDPKGKSDNEIMRFCQSLMVELFRYIGADVDVPAGDVGVGTREIGYLYGQYVRLKNSWSGVLTGKGSAFGGSAGRSEATGHGCIHFCRNMFEHASEDFDGSRIAISGSGTVALHAAEKAIESGARVVTLSDSGGYAYFPDGINREQLGDLARAKREARGTIQEFAEATGEIEYHDNRKPWAVECDIAMPCATENELDADDAQNLIDQGVRAVCEGANMPCTSDAKQEFRHSGVLFGPGRAANAGGVAVSGMELTQNAMRLSWSRDEVDRRLRDTMSDIHSLCVEHGSSDGPTDYIRGAGIASFKLVADALIAYGAT